MAKGRVPGRKGKKGEGRFGKAKGKKKLPKKEKQKSAEELANELMERRRKFKKKKGK
jgi:hypothetical protein